MVANVITPPPRKPSSQTEPDLLTPDTGEKTRVHRLPPKKIMTRISDKDDQRLFHDQEGLPKD